MISQLHTQKHYIFFIFPTKYFPYIWLVLITHQNSMVWPLKQIRFSVLYREFHSLNFTSMLVKGSYKTQFLEQEAACVNYLNMRTNNLAFIFEIE